MSDDNIVKAWETASEATQKFDYFITGATGALCAYISQTYTPEKIAVSANTLELVALLVLVASIVLGLKRLENTITHYKFNLDIVKREARENDDTAALIAIMEEHNNVRRTGVKFYHLRNYTLLVGFILLIVGKVLSAY